GVADVLGRVAGGVDGAQLDVADGEGVAVAQEAVLVAAPPLLLVQPARVPVFAAFAADIGDSALLGELADTGKEVGVDVGFRGSDDAKAVLGGEGDVAVDVALGVDDDRLTG